MKVKELIVMLERMDDDLDVICITKDPNLIDINRPFKSLEINSIDLAKTKLINSSGKLPSVKLKQSSAHADMQVVIELGAEFNTKSQFTYDRRRGVERRATSRMSHSASGFSI